MPKRFMGLGKIVSFISPALIVAVIGITICGVMLQVRVHAAPVSDAVKTIVIPVEGMSCASCVARVKRTLKAIDGVVEVNVDLVKRSARVRYIEGRVTPEHLVDAINNLGYKAGTPKSEGVK